MFIVAVHFVKTSYASHKKPEAIQAIVYALCPGVVQLAGAQAPSQDEGVSNEGEQACDNSEDEEGVSGMLPYSSEPEI